MAYAPWTNGIIKRVNSPILKAIKSLTSEYGLTLAEWPTLLPTITHLINSKRSDTRLGYTPNELFLGQDYKDSLMENDAKRRHVTYLGDGVIKPKKPEKIDRYLEKVRKQMMLKRDKVYRYVLTKRVTQRQQNKQSHFERD